MRVGFTSSSSANRQQQARDIGATTDGRRTPVMTIASAVCTIGSEVLADPRGHVAAVNAVDGVLNYFPDHARIGSH